MVVGTTAYDIDRFPELSPSGMSYLFLAFSCPNPGIDKLIDLLIRILILNFTRFCKLDAQKIEFTVIWITFMFW